MLPYGKYWWAHNLYGIQVAFTVIKLFKGHRGKKKHWFVLLNNWRVKKGHFHSKLFSVKWELSCVSLWTPSFRDLLSFLLSVWQLKLPGSHPLCFLWRELRSVWMRQKEWEKKEKNERGDEDYSLATFIPMLHIMLEYSLQCRLTDGYWKHKLWKSVSFQNGNRL